MGDIEFDINVDNKRVANDIKDDIESGARKGAFAATAEAQEAAETRIREVGAIFSGELIQSFDISYRRRGGMLWVRLENNAEHAAPIEYGADYTDRGPPVAALIPWVRTKMMGFQVPQEDENDLPDPENVDEDLTVPEPDGSYTDLAKVVAPETLKRAFWLQQHIKEQGIDAVRYMQHAKAWAEAHADEEVADYISQELRS